MPRAEKFPLGPFQILSCRIGWVHADSGRGDAGRVVDQFVGGEPWAARQPPRPALRDRPVRGSLATSGGSPFCWPSDVRGHCCYGSIGTGDRRPSETPVSPRRPVSRRLLEAGVSTPVSASVPEFSHGEAQRGLAFELHATADAAGPCAAGDRRRLRAAASQADLWTVHGRTRLTEALRASRRPHSDYFSEGFMREYWHPWIREGRVVQSGYEGMAKPSPYWVSLVSVNSFLLLILLLTLFVVYGVVF